jgi:hypothetical protein
MGEFNPMLLVKLLLGSAFLLTAVFLLFCEEVIFGVLFLSIYISFNGWAKIQAPKLVKSSPITELSAAWTSFDE